MPPPVCRALFRALAGRGRFPSGGDLNSTQEFGAGSLAIALPTQGGQGGQLAQGKNLKKS